MQFIKFLWKISWRNILIATIAGLISGVGNAILISLINRSIHESTLPNVLLYFIIFAISVVLTSIFSQFLLIDLSQNAVYKLRLKLSENILSSPLQHLEKLGENRLLATLIDDIRVLSHSLSTIPNICIDIATALGCLVYLAKISGTIFALTVFASAISIGYVQTRMKKARHLFQTSREEEDNLFKHFQAIAKGIKELKLNRSKREDFSSNHLRSSVAQVRQRNKAAMKSFAVAHGLGQLTQFITLGLIVLVLPQLMHIPLSILSSYILITGFLTLPLQNLLIRVPDLLRANVALDKIHMMELSLMDECETAPAYPTKIEQISKLEIVGASYLYQADGHNTLPPSAPPLKLPDLKSISKSPSPNHDRPRQNGEMNGNGKNGRITLQEIPIHNGQEQGFMLGPIDLSLHSGQVTFVVGGNGSGKSTLAKLITGLYLPQSGAIYLDDVLITESNQEWYRQHFSAVFSDFYLFDQCLGFNYSNLDRDVEKYLKELQLDHKVRVKDGVLSTINLSQGQRKRLALLMAYLEDRPIYLFDEWASDQEPLFRDLFYREILTKLKQRGKAVLVITHDDRYFHLADQLIKLNYGKIEMSKIATC